MAEQDSLIQLKGRVGNVSFYKTKDGYMARKKGGVSAERIKSDPRFERTRENGSEFGRAGIAAKTIRNGLKNVLVNCIDKRMSPRLTTEMMKVLQSDPVSARGERKVSLGNLALLTGFDFNIDGKLTTAFFAPIASQVDRSQAKAIIDIPAFSTKNMLAFPDSATHCRLKAAAAEIDFDENVATVVSAESGMLTKSIMPQPPLQLAMTINGSSVLPFFVLLGVEFFQHVNGVDYPLNNGAFNAMAIVRVDHV